MQRPFVPMTRSSMPYGSVVHIEVIDPDDLPVRMLIAWATSARTGTAPPRCGAAARPRHTRMRQRREGDMA